MSGMISNELRTLVRLTAEHAHQWNDGEDHTVAAGLLTTSGDVILGLNTHHFLGGPCGEIAALSNHASSTPHDPIVAVAANYGPTGSAIAPCGKCRQVFFDINPSISFVVREANGLTTRTAAELLPFAYDWRAAEHPQRLYVWEGYEELIRSGTKTQTIRIDDPFRPGPAEVVFEKEAGDVVALSAIITDVYSIARAEATEEIALRDGFSCLDELQNALDAHYPGLAADDRLDVVRFTLDRTDRTS